MARWDIFCSVVDNYGDIGVTWRLARQLAAEQGHAVRLWVDDLAAFVRLCPEVSVDAECQHLLGVEVRRWAEPFPVVEPAQVVIEAFACQLPPAYVAAMAASGTRRLWLNLEYLSAEDWVAGCHGLPSPQLGGLQKFFFFLASWMARAACCVRLICWRSAVPFRLMLRHSRRFCNRWV